MESNAWKGVAHTDNSAPCERNQGPPLCCVTNPHLQLAELADEVLPHVPALPRLHRRQQRNCRLGGRQGRRHLPSQVGHEAVAGGHVLRRTHTTRTHIQQFTHRKRQCVRLEQLDGAGRDT